MFQAIRFRKMIIPGVMLLLLLLFINQQAYLPVSILLLGLACVPFFLRYEKKQLRAEEISLIALLGTAAAVSRLPFASLPGIQPTSFIIFMTALVFGVETGFMVGAFAAIISNLFLGQGPWTPWQIFAWGMMGASTGLWRNQWWMISRIGKSLYGFLWGVIFGWIMNLWVVIGFLEAVNWRTAAAVFAASFYFDLVHGISNGILLFVFAARWERMLTRVKSKYGLLQ